MLQPVWNVTQPWRSESLRRSKENHLNLEVFFTIWVIDRKESRTFFELVLDERHGFPITSCGVRLHDVVYNR
jgi:hypothetical protein